MVENKGLFSIGVVERDTGIGRDTLRVWERRYGFPEPVRNDKGERKYSEMQLRRLQRIRRLLDRGMRPGKLLPLSEDALDELEASLQPETPQKLDATVSAILEAIRSADAGQVDTLFRTQYEKQGMKGFVLNTVVPLLNAVGELWISGKLQVFQEHFLSQQLIRFLNTEIAKIQKSAERPLVLLATLPGEEHTLGLLMVSAMLSSAGHFSHQSRRRGSNGSDRPSGRAVSCRRCGHYIQWCIPVQEYSCAFARAARVDTR